VKYKILIEDGGRKADDRNGSKDKCLELSALWSLSSVIHFEFQPPMIGNR